MDQALLSGAEQQDKRQRAESGTHKIPSEYEEEFYCVVIEQLPRKGLKSPSLEISKSHLDTILRGSRGVLFEEGAWTRSFPMVPSSLNQSGIL